jgi:hypothetical protein
MTECECLQKGISNSYYCGKPECPRTKAIQDLLNSALKVRTTGFINVEFNLPNRKEPKP